jgi:spore coat protein U-like protein
MSARTPMHPKRTTRVVRTLAALAFAVHCNGAFAIACSLTVTGLSFGNYDLFSATALDTTGNVDVTCAKDAADGNGAITVAYAVALSAGSSNSLAQRTMLSGSDALQYNVYSNSLRTVVWGAGATSQLTSSMKLTGPRGQQTNSHSAYGRAPPLQDVGAGLYADTLVLTLTF